MNIFLHYIKSMKLKSFMLLVSLSLSLVAMMVYFLFTYNMTLDVINNKVDDINNNVMAQTDRYLSGEMFELETYTKNIIENEKLIADIVELESLSKSDLAWSTSIEGILNRFVNTSYLHDSIYNSYIVTPTNLINRVSAFESNTQYLTYESIADSDIANIVAESPNKISLFTKDQVGISSEQYFFIGEIDLNEGLKGYFVLTLTHNWLNVLAGYNSDNLAIISGSTNHLIYGNNPKIAEMYNEVKPEYQTKASSKYEDINYKDGKKYSILVTKLKYRDLYAVFLRSDTDNLSPITQMRLSAMVIALFSVVLSFALSSFLTKRIYKPLSSLTDVTRQYQKNQTALLRLETKKTQYSFRETISTYLLMAVMLPVLLYHLSFFFISSNIIKNTVTNLMNISINNTVSNLDLFIQRNKRISQNIMFDPIIQEYLVKEQVDGSEGDLSRIQNVITSNIEIVKEIKSIKIYDNSGKIRVSSGSDVENLNQKHFKTLSDSIGEVCVFNERDSYTKSVEIIIGRKINCIYDITGYRNSHIGYIEITYGEETLAQIYDSLRIKDSSSYISSINNELISAKNSNGIMTSLTLDKITQSSFENINVYTKKCELAPWIYTIALPNDYISHDATDLFNMGFVVIGILFFLTLLISKLIARRFQNPIVSLMNHIDGETKTKGEFWVNELNDLTDSFNSMIERAEKIVELEKENNDVELIALRSQINPHFLYNAFEQIKWMSDAGEKANVEMMLNNLTKLFRLGINEEKIFISVAEEVEYTKAYLDIQLLRYDNSFNINWNVDDSLKEYYVPKLILQPLAENAIYHGIRELEEGGGVLSIYGFADKGKLIFKVCDTGPGFTEEKRKEITECLRTNEKFTHSIGLFNVNRRLHLSFHDKYKIEITSQPFVNTEITIEFPIGYTPP